MFCQLIKKKLSKKIFFFINFYLKKLVKKNSQIIKKLKIKCGPKICFYSKKCKNMLKIAKICPKNMLLEFYLEFLNYSEMDKYLINFLIRHTGKNMIQHISGCPDYYVGDHENIKNNASAEMCNVKKSDYQQ